MALAEKILYANNAFSTLAAGISDVATALAVQAGHGARFPNPGSGECYIITLRDAIGNVETMKCTARSTDTFSTLVRAQDGTSARAWTAGDKVEIRLTRLHVLQLVTQDGRNLFAVGGGTGDAITAVFSPTFAGLVDGMELRVRAPGANGITTPTFSPDGLTAKIIVKGFNKALHLGDIPGAGYEMRLSYQATWDRWVLLNPANVDTTFTTGDGKLTLKTAADSGWVLANDGSIGNAASGGTTRANADTEALFTLLWTNILNTWCPTQDSAGTPVARGANAAADFAANRRIVLPKALGRALSVYGSGSGLTARALGETLGTETHVLSVGEMPAHDHGAVTGAGGDHSHGGATGSDGSHSHGLTPAVWANAGGANVSVAGGSGFGDTLATTQSAGAHSHTIAASGTHTHPISSQGGGGAHNNMPPVSFWNAMVKL